MKRKICVVTGTRAEYGLLFWLLSEIKQDSALDLQLVVTGSHLSPEFGLTYTQIERDGFTINEKVEILLSSDGPVGISTSIGLGVIGFAGTFSRLKPDILVVLGDRYEILAAVQAALVARIPVAHIAGGEVTEGAIDDSIRHAITKMSHLHFVGAEPYRRRVIQLGENPEAVFAVGDTGIENIAKLSLLSRNELEQQLDFKFGELNFLVTYHPVTLGDVSPELVVEELFHALDCFPKAKVIITYANADTGGRVINKKIDDYSIIHSERVMSVPSLGQLRYISAIKICDVVIGNSSSGIVEAPFLKKPTVNIGMRQEGRLKARSIIDCGENREEIAQAIQHAIGPEFQQSLGQVESVYGNGNSSNLIKEILKHTDIHHITRKKFYDL